MTSNVSFNATSVINDHGNGTENSATNHSENETEDEEVRMNCVGGFRGIEDSDVNTTDNSDYADDAIATDDESSLDGFRITHFVTNPYKSKVSFICPKPKSAPAVLKRLSPLAELDDEPDTIDDRTNIEVNSDSYDSVDTKSDAEVDRPGNEMRGNLEDKAFLDPYPQSFEAELTEIMVSIGDALELVLDESESSSRPCYLGVMKDVETSATIIRKPKRALCQSADQNDHIIDVNKKSRSVTIDMSTYMHPIALLQTSRIEQSRWPYSRYGLLSRIDRGDESPTLLSEDDHDDALDRQLGEELCSGDQHGGDGQETPVPLLTPPGSPLTVEWEGASTTLCEWPSNLIVDSAMLQAANELRPMSPTSLENLERDEHDRIVAFTVGGSGNNDFLMTTTTVLSPHMLKSVVGAFA